MNVRGSKEDAHPGFPPRTPVLKKQFSLFEGDLVNRVFGQWGQRKMRHWVYRSLTMILLTWIPLAIAAVIDGQYSLQVNAQNFFADFAAYAQFIIALPLFVLAESVIEHSTRRAARDFIHTGVVRPLDFKKVENFHLTAERLRQSTMAELILVILAYLIAYLTISPELDVCASLQTWHTTLQGSEKVLTLPGMWLLLVSLPVLNYWWLRFAWKIFIWTRYLYQITRLRLVLVASHPDKTGGVGFISEVQGRFALLILAYGISNVAAVVAYKVSIEGASITLMPVWGPMVGFVIGAPLLFTLPLFMFTKQLHRIKKRAMNQFRKKAMHHSIEFEQQWLKQMTGFGEPKDLSFENLNSFSDAFDRVTHMRVVPFDLRSAAQLIGSSVGAVATVLPLINFKGPLQAVLEIVAAIFKIF